MTAIVTGTEGAAVSDQPPRAHPAVRTLAAVAVTGATAGTGFLAGWATGIDVWWSIVQGLALGAAAAVATLREDRGCRVTRHGV